MRAGGGAQEPDRDGPRVDAAGDPRDEPIPERLDLLAGAGGRVEDREAFDRLLGDEFGDALARLAPGPLSLSRGDRPVAHGDDRLDREECTDGRLRRRETAALPEVVQGVDGDIEVDVREAIADALPRSLRPTCRSAASSAASSAGIPVDMDVEPVSMRRISRSGSICAASVALWNVADSFEPIRGATIASAPSAKQASNASLKVPGDGAAVDGITAPGASIFVQNSSVERFTPAWNSSSPNRTYSGTTRMPAAAAMAGARSAVESVTIATCPMEPSSLIPQRNDDRAWRGRPAAPRSEVPG